MYIVIDKETKRVIHKNPADVELNLSPKEIYAGFNENTMGIAWCKGELPKYWKVLESGEIVEANLEDKVNAGIIPRPRGMKAVENTWVGLTVAEMVEIGDIILNPDEKVIPEKNDIEKKTTIERLESGVTELDYAKAELRQQYSDLSLLIRRSIIPDYKLINCSLGIYEKDYVKRVKKTIQAFRKEFYRIEAEISSAKDVEELKNITVNFPMMIFE